VAPSRACEPFRCGRKLKPAAARPRSFEIGAVDEPGPAVPALGAARPGLEITDLLRSRSATSGTPGHGRRSQLRNRRSRARRVIASRERVGARLSKRCPIKLTVDDGSAHRPIQPAAAGERRDHDLGPIPLGSPSVMAERRDALHVLKLPLASLALGSSHPGHEAPWSADRGYWVLGPVVPAARPWRFACRQPAPVRPRPTELGLTPRETMAFEVHPRACSAGEAQLAVGEPGHVFEGHHGGRRERRGGHRLRAPRSFRATVVDQATTHDRHGHRPARCLLGTRFVVMGDKTTTAPAEVSPVRSPTVTYSREATIRSRTRTASDFGKVTVQRLALAMAQMRGLEGGTRRDSHVYVVGGRRLCSPRSTSTWWAPRRSARRSAIAARVTFTRLGVSRGGRSRT